VSDAPHPQDPLRKKATVFIFSPHPAGEKREVFSLSAAVRRTGFSK
jgi:hypothetical protein